MSYVSCFVPSFLCRPLLSHLPDPSDRGAVQEFLSGRFFGAKPRSQRDRPIEGFSTATTSVFSGRETQTSHLRATSAFPVSGNTDVDREYTLWARRSRVRALLALTHMTSVFSVPEPRTSPAWRRRCDHERKRCLCFRLRKHRRQCTDTRNENDVRDFSVISRKHGR